MALGAELLGWGGEERGPCCSMDGVAHGTVIQRLFGVAVEQWPFVGWSCVIKGDKHAHSLAADACLVLAGGERDVGGQCVWGARQPRVRGAVNLGNLGTDYGFWLFRGLPPFLGRRVRRMRCSSWSR